MTNKTYRTAQGKVVDLGALMLQNENTRAVGNMKVNARGDLVDGWNRPIDSRSQQVQKQYDRQVTNVRDEPVVTAAAPMPAPSRTKPAKETRAAKTPAPTPAPTTESTTTGLAAAIARAREIRQEPMQTPQQIAQNQPGVRRI
jgi:hypothetical protein